MRLHNRMLLAIEILESESVSKSRLPPTAINSLPATHLLPLRRIMMFSQYSYISLSKANGSLLFSVDQALAQYSSKRR
jgi:hypothetical protein